MHAPKFWTGLATGAFALTLGLWAEPTPAQDGPPPGPPVTNSKTNRQNPKGDNRKTPSQVLPGVPATASDPAPPGTRSVRVDQPGAAGNATGTGAGATGAANGAGNGRRPAGNGPRILQAEGVVTRIDRAGKTLNGELERFAFDPSQDWMTYVNQGASGVPEKDDERPKTTAAQKEANAKQHEDDPDKPTVLEMAITRRTYTYTHARTEDGTDMYSAATSATPDTTGSRSGETRATPTTGQRGVADRPLPTNFTNLKEGSFVSVRYRKVGDVNEVLNLTLIELPLNPIPANASNGGQGQGANGTTKANTRTPAVPLTPAGVNIPR